MATTDPRDPFDLYSTEEEEDAEEEEEKKAGAHPSERRHHHHHHHHHHHQQGHYNFFLDRSALPPQQPSPAPSPATSSTALQAKKITNPFLLPFSDDEPDSEAQDTPLTPSLAQLLHQGPANEPDLPPASNTRVLSFDLYSSSSASSSAASPERWTDAYPMATATAIPPFPDNAIAEVDEDETGPHYDVLQEPSLSASAPQPVAMPLYDPTTELHGGPIERVPSALAASQQLRSASEPSLLAAAAHAQLARARTSSKPAALVPSSASTPELLPPSLRFPSPPSLSPSARQVPPRALSGLLPTPPALKVPRTVRVTGDDETLVTVACVLPNRESVTLSFSSRATVKDVKVALWKRALKGCVALRKRWMNEGWWHGLLAQDEAEALLRQRRQQGCFLLRKMYSAPRSIILSVWYNSHVYHYPVTCSDHEVVSLTLDGKDVTFASPVHFVRYFQLHPLPVTPTTHVALGPVCESRPRNALTEVSVLGQHRFFQVVEKQRKLEIFDLEKDDLLANYHNFWLSIDSTPTPPPPTPSSSTPASSPSSTTPIRHLRPLYVETLPLSLFAQPGRALAMTVVFKPFLARAHNHHIYGDTPALDSDLQQILGSNHATINSLLSDAEVQEARGSLRALAESVARRRDPVEYALAANLSSHPIQLAVRSRLVDGKLRLCIAFDESELSTLMKVLMVPGNALPSDVIAMVLAEPASERQRLGLRERCSGDEYILHVPDRAEYLAGPHALLDFKYVRHCLLHDQPIFLRFTLRRTVPLLLKELHEGAAPAPHVLDGDLTAIDPSPEVAPAHKDISLANSIGRDSTWLSVWDVDRNFRVNIVSIEALTLSTKAFPKVMSVSASICHGERILTPPVFTPRVDIVQNNANFDCWLALPVKFSDLPRSSRLLVTVWGVERGEDTALCWAAIHIFDHHGFLRVDRASFSLVEVERDERDEPLPPALTGYTPERRFESNRCTLDFDMFHCPVIYPNATGPYVDDDGLRDRDAAFFRREAAEFLAKSHPSAAQDRALAHAMAAPAAPSPATAPSATSMPASTAPTSGEVDNTGDTKGRVIELPVEFVSLVLRLANARSGVRASDHWYKMRKYRRSFTGKELMAWLQDDMGDVPHQNVLLAAKRLFSLRVIRHVTDEADFEDSTQLYTFREFTSVRAAPWSGAGGVTAAADASQGQASPATLRRAEQQANMQKAEAQVALANQKVHDSKRLAALCRSDLLKSLSDSDRQLLFRRRHDSAAFPQLLPKFLLSIEWGQACRVREAYRMIAQWSTDAPVTDALELLHYDHVDCRVREYAVSRLRALSDDDMESFLLQLVQVIRFEPYHDSPLVRLLLERALLNRRLGQAFFCHLKSELGDPTLGIRCAILLEAYVYGCGASVRRMLCDQTAMLENMQSLAMIAGVAKGGKLSRTTALRQALAERKLPTGVPTIYDVSIILDKPNTDKCFVLDSKKKPLWLEFCSIERASLRVPIIYKYGDDLRQDMLTLQMIRLMDKLWQQDGLDLCMTPYGVVATGSDRGVIQVVPNATTVAEIQRSAGGSMGVFKEEVLLDWLRAQNVTSDEAFENARDTFTLSCAGYCVATYVLGIGDRHNGNIMVTKDGRFFHIDFGHFLGNIKSKFGVKRERAPFVLTPDFVFVMDKKDGARFKRFLASCVKAYLILRRQAGLLIALLAMMLSTGIPELRNPEDISYLREALCLDMSEDQAATCFTKLIHSCLKMAWSTQMNFWMHNLAH